MSKALDMLNKVEDQRHSPPGKYSLAMAQEKGLSPREKGLSPKGTVPMLSILLPIITLALCVALFAIAMFQITKNNKSAEYTARLAKLEQAMDENNRKLRFISTDIKADLEKIGLRLGHIKERVSQFEKNTEANTFAIDNLTKAKNTLFGRVSALEASKGPDP